MICAYQHEPDPVPLMRKGILPRFHDWYRVKVQMMNRALSKKSIALLLAIALLIAIQLNSASRSVRSSLAERSAVVSAEVATIHVMPSRLTATISIGFRGQRLMIREPSIFDFYRARCNQVDGWISRDHVTLLD